MKNTIPAVDLSSTTKRQIYLITFPLGAFAISTFVYINLQTVATLSAWIAFGISCMLIISSGVLFWRPKSLGTVEALFYYFMCFFIPAFSASNLNNADAISHSTPEHFSEVINGMTVWVVIFIVGAHLAITQKILRYLIVMVFTLIFTIGARNLALLQNAGRWEIIYLFHWIHSLFAVTVTAFLVLRIGRLQQIYAMTDHLTGILNRREASKILLSEYERALRNNSLFAVILIDIDHFKLVNDTFGHPIGDLVLKEFADVILKNVRKNDYVARWGGEEFLIILPNLDLDGARLTGERIRVTINDTTFGEVEHMTASLGVSVYKPGRSLEDLLVGVDSALYQSKHNGRNLVTIFE